MRSGKDICLRLARQNDFYSASSPGRSDTPRYLLAPPTMTVGPVLEHLWSLPSTTVESAVFVWGLQRRQSLFQYECGIIVSTTAQIFPVCALDPTPLRHETLWMSLFINGTIDTKWNKQANAP